MLFVQYYSVVYSTQCKILRERRKCLTAFPWKTNTWETIKGRWEDKKFLRNSNRVCFFSRKKTIKVGWEGGSFSISKRLGCFLELLRCSHRERGALSLLFHNCFVDIRTPQRCARVTGNSPKECQKHATFPGENALENKSLVISFSLFHHLVWDPLRSISFPLSLCSGIIQYIFFICHRMSSCPFQNDRIGYKK